MSAEARKPSSIGGMYIRDVCDAPDRVVIAGAARISGVFCGGPWVGAAMRCSCRCATISEMTNSSRTAAQALAMARTKNDFAGVAGSPLDLVRPRTQPRAEHTPGERPLAGPATKHPHSWLDVQCKGKASPAELGRRRLGARRSVK